MMSDTHRPVTGHDLLHAIEAGEERLAQLRAGNVPRIWRIGGRRATSLRPSGAFGLRISTW
jgi:hypothetical protein